MASGIWEIPFVSAAYSVDFIESLPNALFVLDPNNPVSGAKTGSASFDVGGTGEILLDGLPFTLLTLPQGFQITLISRVGLSGVEGPPNGALAGVGFTSDTIQGSDRTIPSWDTDFGWNQASAPVNEAAQRSMLTGYQLNIDFAQVNGSGFAWSSCFGPDAPLIMTFDGVWDDLGTVVTPSPPVATTGPGPGEITVTPGANTVIVIVEVPANPAIIVPVTPGVPVVITVPPGPATITPVNIPITTGPSVTIGDVVIEGDLTIDVALQATMQFLVNPSGIYTLVPGKHYDTLYMRLTNTTTSQNVRIPNPFIKTYLVGE